MLIFIIFIATEYTNAMFPENLKARLQEPFIVSDEQLTFYHKNRFIKLKQVLDTETLDYVNGIISKSIELYQL